MNARRKINEPSYAEIRSTQRIRIDPQSERIINNVFLPADRPTDALTQVNEPDMSARRSTLEIMLSVLSSVNDGVGKPTRIMNASHISWHPVQQILADLTEQELIREIQVPGSGKPMKRYEITEKGVNTLDFYRGAGALIDIENSSYSYKNISSSSDR